MASTTEDDIEIGVSQPCRKNRLFCSKVSPQNIYVYLRVDEQLDWSKRSGALTENVSCIRSTRAAELLNVNRVCVELRQTLRLQVAA